MASCPQCNTPVEEGQRFCANCGAPLTPEAAQAAPSRPAMPTWGMGALIGAGVVIVLLLVMLMSRTAAPPPAPPAPPPVAVAPAPPPSPPAPVKAEPPAKPAEPPPAPVPDLKGELLNVLNSMKDGHLRKDIVLYMSTYSLTYPGLDAKRKATLKSWENYDYLNLVFTLNDIQSLDADNAVAKATWYIDTRNRRNQELSSDQQTYEIRFAKEQGKWRIRSLKEQEEEK